MEAEIQDNKSLFSPSTKLYWVPCVQYSVINFEDVSKVNRLSSLLCVYDLGWGNDPYT